MFRNFPLLLGKCFLPSKNKWKFGWKTLQFSFRFSMSRVACASHLLSAGISNRLRFSKSVRRAMNENSRKQLRVWKWKFSIENEGEILSFQHRMFFDFNFKVVDFSSICECVGWMKIGKKVNRILRMFFSVPECFSFLKTFPYPQTQRKRGKIFFACKQRWKFLEWEKSKAFGFRFLLAFFQGQFRV